MNRQKRLAALGLLAFLAIFKYLDGTHSVLVFKLIWLKLCDRIVQRLMLISMRSFRYWTVAQCILFLGAFPENWGGLRAMRISKEREL